jgi:hypothetical protein
LEENRYVSFVLTAIFMPEKNNHFLSVFDSQFDWQKLGLHRVWGIW